MHETHTGRESCRVRDPAGARNYQFKGPRSGTSGSITGEKAFRTPRLEDRGSSIVTTQYTCATCSDVSLRCSLRWPIPPGLHTFTHRDRCHRKQEQSPRLEYQIEWCVTPKGLPTRPRLSSLNTWRLTH
jgi:hypothetical protein